MSLFRELPTTTFLNQKIVNLAIGVKLNQLVEQDALSFLDYVAESGMQPDHIAHDYYEDSKYAWLVLLANKIVDPYFQWPLDTYDFDQWIKKKYGSIAAAQATTIHCEHKTKKLTVSADSLTVSNGVSSSDYDAIDAYTYWDRINDNRRHLKIVNRVYLPSIDKQLKDLMSDG